MRRQQHWVPYPSQPDLIQSLSLRHGMPELVAKILLNRGLEQEEDIEAFLDPTLARLLPPFGMQDLDTAVERLTQAVYRSEPLVVYGDYDVDGITAASVLIQFFRALGVPATAYIPDRLTQGYGLQPEVITGLAKESKLLVTVDCGISNVAEVALGKKLGMDIIITDHHEVPESMPPALAVINPKRTDCSYPFQDLAGVGVALNLLLGVRARLREKGWFRTRPEPNLRAYLDLVALGTAADVVPLVGQNRILIRQGLQVLASTTRPGLVALKEIAQLEGRPLSMREVVFRLTPRLNAAGRMGQPRGALELLLTDDLDQARALARHLDSLNRQRQTLEQKILQEAVLQAENENLLDRPALVLAGEGWHPGVIGIVAARLAELYYRPVALISLQNGAGRGSARSIAPFNLYAGLAACRSYLLQFGGHRAAAGFTLAAENLLPFRRAFEEAVTRELGSQTMRPTLSVDAEVALEELDDEFFQQLDRLRPFGQGNPEPVLTCLEAEVLNSRVVGERHLKLQLASSSRLEAIAFNLGNYHPMRGQVDIAFSPRLNYYQGRYRPELRVLDLGPIRSGK